MIDKIRKKKLDALCARIIHEQQLAKLKRLSRITDYFAFGVPTAYLPVRYAAKGTETGIYIEFIWIILAASLSVLSLIKLISKWQDNAERHSKLIGENVSLVTQADDLLSRPNDLTADNTRFFFLMSDILEKDDRGSLGVPKPEAKKYAYREALKEYEPNSTEATCPVCKASPWNFKPGSCQSCGNIPIAERK